MINEALILTMYARDRDRKDVNSVSCVHQTERHTIRHQGLAVSQPSVNLSLELHIHPPKEPKTSVQNVL